MSDATRTRRIGWRVPTLSRRHRRELLLLVASLVVGVALFLWLVGMAKPVMTDAQIQSAMVENINHWSDATWYLDIDGTPGSPNVQMAAGVLTVGTRLAPDTPAATAYALCLKVASITHDPTTAVRLAIDRVVVLSGQKLLARCFTPNF